MRKIWQQMRNWLIVKLVGKMPVAMNIAIGLPDRNSWDTFSQQPVIAKYSRSKSPLLIKHVCIYKSSPDPRELRSFEIDYITKANAITIDPAELEK